MYQIVQAPSEILRSATKPISIDVTKIVEEMKKTLIAQKDPEGVGLAANQVGLPYKLFLARFSARKTEPIRVFINPKIVSHSEDFQVEKRNSSLEGCLSVPKLYGLVKRWKSVTLQYKTETGEDKTETFEGFPAVVIQHEMDHLNGKIFVERILEQNGRLYKMTGKNSEGKDEWEEITLE